MKHKDEDDLIIAEKLVTARSQQEWDQVWDLFSATFTDKTLPTKSDLSVENSDVPLETPALSEEEITESTSISNDVKFVDKDEFNLYKSKIHNEFDKTLLNFELE
jgi:hypothetical protein